MSKPWKITKKQITEIAILYRIGLSTSRVAALVEGINQHTLRKHLIQGDADSRKGVLSQARRLLEAVEHAKATLEAEKLKIIHDSKDWKAAKWFLEAKFMEGYGPHAKEDLSKEHLENQGVLFEDEVDAYKVKDLKQLTEETLARLTA